MSTGRVVSVCEEEVHLTDVFFEGEGEGEGVVILGWEDGGSGGVVRRRWVASGGRGCLGGRGWMGSGKVMASRKVLASRHVVVGAVRGSMSVVVTV